MALTKPTQITVPFASTGLKNTIPETATGSNRASMQEGFPAITMQDVDQGGMAPYGQDMNGIIYDVTKAIQYQQAGGFFPYDATFAAAIDGYPIGAIVTSADGTQLFQNTLDGNQSDPENGGANWSNIMTSASLAGKQDKLNQTQMDAVNSGITSAKVAIYDSYASTKQNTLTFDNTPTNGSSNPVTSDGIYAALGAKQDNLTIDATPASGSTNPVSSGGVYTALSGKVDISNANSAEVTATGSTTARTLANRFADVINVRDFGAKGDGTTDDTSALNAAMTAATGKTLFIPAGTYLISDSLGIPSNTTVVGAGKFQTIIKLANSVSHYYTPCITNLANVGCTETSDTGTGNENIYVEGLCADGNGMRTASGSAGTNGSAWCWKNVHNLVMKDCAGINGRLHCLDISSDNYGSPQSGGDSAYFTGASSQVLIDGFYGKKAVLDDIITTHYSHDIILQNCVCTNDTSFLSSLAFNQCGIEVDDGSSDVLVKDCYVENCVRGIFFAKGHTNVNDRTISNTPIRNVTIEGCSVRGCGTNYYSLYSGNLPLGKTVIKDCTSFSPVSLQCLSEDTGNNCNLIHLGGANLYIDGFNVINDAETKCNAGIYINPLIHYYESVIDIRNVFFQNVKINTSTDDSNSKLALIRFTGSVQEKDNASVTNVISINGSDCPVVYCTTDFFRIKSVYAINDGTTHTFAAVRCNGAGATNGRPSYFEDIHQVGYAGKVQYGTHILNSTSYLSRFGAAGSMVDGLVYVSGSTTYTEESHRLTCPPTFFLGERGVVTSYGRNDQSGEFDDASVGAWLLNTTVDGVTYKNADLTLSVRAYNGTAPEKRWAVDGKDFSFRPCSDNTYSVGSSTLRPSVVYAGSGTINTSDERLKDNIRSINDDVLDAWGDVNLKFFQFKDAIERKGDYARIHAGVIAQQVQEAFGARGLDAFRFGLLCYDEWDDVFVTETIVDQEAEFDEEGNEVTPAVTHEEQRQVQEAGNRYSIRYDEAFILEAAYQRRRADRIEARLAALEERMA